MDIYGYTALLLVGLLILIVVWQGAKWWQFKDVNRYRAANEEQYRKLMEESIAVQQKLVEMQQRTTEELLEVRTGIASIEKMLREID